MQIISRHKELGDDKVRVGSGYHNNTQLIWLCHQKTENLLVADAGVKQPLKEA